ncbi:MAG: uroporphyrinogen decarboxylase family protein [Bacteroidota bacterium]
MTSRERVLASIDHKEPDKVPVDLGAHPSSGISAMAYNNLKKHLGYDHPTKVYDVVQQLAEPDDSIIEHFGVDVLDVGRVFNTDPSKWYDIKLADGSTAQYPIWFKPVNEEDGSWSAYDDDGDLLARMPDKAAFFDQTLFPFLDSYPADYKKLPEAMDKVLWGKFATSPWDHANEENFYETLREKTLKLRENSDKALMIGAGCNLFEWGTFLRRLDNFLMDVLVDPVNVEKLLDALVEIHLNSLEKICNAVGDAADIVKFGDDLGMTKGMFMPAEIYQSLFKPRHKIMCDYVKKNSNMKICLHSCGSIEPIIPDLIEAGFEILNPVQTNCKDMDPVKLKNKFGSEVTFWGGGADTTNILNKSTPEEIRKHVLERLEIFSKGGGFVFNQVHNILPEVPPENIVAMFDTVKEFNS